MHETEITELTQGENYTYIQQREDVGCNDSLNEEWRYKRYGLHYTANINNACYPCDHSYIWNTPVDKKKIEWIHVKTYKILCQNGSFHVNDVGRLWSVVIMD